MPRVLLENTLQITATRFNFWRAPSQGLGWSGRQAGSVDWWTAAPETRCNLLPGRQRAARPAALTLLESGGSYRHLALGQTGTAAMPLE